MSLNKIRNHTLVCATLALVMAKATMPDTYAQSNIPADIQETQLRFAGSDVCQPDNIAVPPNLKEASVADQSESPTQIEADEVETEPNARIRLSGNAQVTQGKRGVYADEIVYNRQSYQATATHNVRFYSANGDEVLADSLDMAINTGIGSARNIRVKFVNDMPYYTKKALSNYLEYYSILVPFKNKVSQPPKQTTDDNKYVRIWATADTIEFAGTDYQRLHNAVFSNCEQGKDDVVLVAREIELDHATGIGTAKSIKVKFKHMPIFYLPTASFPINEQRKTGFLFPTVQYQKVSGLIFNVPYYINIAPNHDATMIARVLSNRGVQLYGEYRYLTQKSASIVKAEVLPVDAVFNRGRYALRYHHKQAFNDNWTTNVDFQTLSDTHYVGDFNSGFGVTSASYTHQYADLLYRSPDLLFKAGMSAYQAVNSRVKVADRPYNRLPEFSLNLKPHDLGVFKYGIDSEFTRFTLADNTGQVSGTRFRTKPYISLPIRRIHGYVTPKISVQTIDYSLDNSLGDNSPSLIVPIASVDSGLFFARTFEENGSLFVQTLEPRLFYVNIPARLEQQTLPNFDSADGSNSGFSHFFRENRFFGGDRVGDTRQITLGLTSRIVDHDGQQRLKLSLEKVFFLADRQVGLSATTIPETENQSGFLTEVTANVAKGWNIIGFTRMSSQYNDVEFVHISADYYHSHRRNASLGYSRTKEASEQVNLKFKAPIGRRWQVNMQTKYSTRENKTRDFEIGVTYDGCCWATKLFVERYLDGVGEVKSRFTASLELSVPGRIRSHSDY